MRFVIAFAGLVVLASCDAPSSRESAIAEVQSRANVFLDYPQANTTYLSYSEAHGFQVNFIASGGHAWLWYPRNTVVVPEEWKLDAKGNALCWRHPSASYNPVTKQSGGGFQCESLPLAQKTIVASLPGDPYKLSLGEIPYRLDKCKAPIAFTFDREAYGCLKIG